MDLGGTELIEAVSLQPDGRIVVAGGRSDPATFERNFVLARFDVHGMLDTTFSGDGYVTTHIGTGDLSHAAAIVIQPDARAVATGRVRDSEGATHFALARYLLEIEP
jgi:uncharacterized delta-60 repeat protein